MDECKECAHHDMKLELGQCKKCETIKELPEEGTSSSSEKQNDSSSGESSDNSVSGPDDSQDPDLDGGYGWVIVTGSFFNAFIIDGVGSSFGLLFPYIIVKFGASAFETSFAGSLFVSFLIMGSIAALLVKNFGFRKVSVAGGVLGCVAFVASAFSSNIIIFILTYGLMAGMSCGLVYLPSVIIVNAYFHHKRGLANGIVTSGSGAGLLLLAPLINYLLDNYALDGTIIILAGVLLNMCLFSSLYRPLRPVSHHHDSESSDNYSFGNVAVDSQSSNLSLQNDDVMDEKSMEINEKENSCIKADGEEQESHHRNRWESAHLDTSAVGIGESQDQCATERQPVSRLEYLLSRLKPGVSAPPKNVKKYGFERSNRDNGHTKSAQWKSEYQLDIKGAQQVTNGCPVHSSVHNLPSWCQDKISHMIPQNSMMKQQRHHHHHRSHHHHLRLHPSHQPQWGFLSLDHGSNFYLTGSLSTLRNLHTKHVIQSLQNTLPPAVQPQDSASKLEINITELPVAPTGASEIETLIVPQEKITESNHNCEADRYSRYSEMHISNHSINMSGYTSLSDIGHGDLVVLEENTPLSLPPLGYSIAQLLRMPTFHLFCLGASLIQIGYPIAGTFLADYAYQCGLTSSHTAILMGLLGGLNICGRLLSGALASFGVDPLHLNNLSLLLGGIACLLCPFYTEFWSLCLLAALFGFLLGFFPPLQPLIVVEYFGLDSLASAFGFLTTIKGVASIVGAPMAGWIYDASGKYTMSFIFAGSAFVSSCFVHCLMPCLQRSKSDRVMHQV